MTHEEMERLFEQESRRLEQHLKEQITAKQEREAIACHVAKLREFRRSGAIMDGADCWLDKEIADLEALLRADRMAA